MKYFILTVLILIQSSLFAITYTTVSNGDWTNSSTWDANGAPGNYWGASDQVIINHNVNLNQNVGYAGSIQITAGNSLTGLSNNIALYNGASITSAGDLSVNNLTLNSTSNGSITGELIVNNNLVVGSGSTLTCTNTVEVRNNFTNNGGIVVFNDVTEINGNVQNNNGEITFNSSAIIGGNVDNNNASAVLNFNADIDITGYLTLTVTDLLF